MYNCQVWFTVDFGKGPVDVRCTREGEHTHHICQVFFRENPPAEQQKHNVFEDPNEGIPMK